MANPKDKPPEHEDFAKTFTGMLRSQLAIRLRAAEQAYVKALEGTKMNRKQRRQQLKLLNKRKGETNE